MIHDPDLPGTDYDMISVDLTEPRYGIPLGPRILKTHPARQCAGDVCTIHNPSDHHMVSWPQTWRADRRIMERACPHGIGHPDPDDLNVRRGDGAHGCDGCCRPPVGTPAD